MSPFVHTVLRFVWNLLGVGAGAVVGAALLESGALAWMGPRAGVAPLLGGAVGVVSALLLWQRYAWVRCPACGSRMGKTALGGRMDRAL